MSGSATYTISFDAKSNVDGKQINFGFRYRLTNSDGTTSDEDFYDGRKTLGITKNWNRVWI